MRKTIYWFTGVCFIGLCLLLIHFSSTQQTLTPSSSSNPSHGSMNLTEEIPRIKDHKQLISLLKERIKLKQEFYKSSSVGMEATEAQDGAADAEQGGGEGSSDTSTSTTNIQVEGIDEGDILKADGSYLYFVRENDIIIASAEDADSKIIANIKEEQFHPQQLLLHNDYLISIGITHGSIRPLEEKKVATSNKQGHDMAISYPTFSNQTTVFIYDISDPHSPNQIREFTFEGNLLASRKKDGYLYLVANHYPPIYYFIEGDGLNNAAEIRPFVKDTAVSDEGQPVEFDSMYFFPESHDESFMLVSSIDLNEMTKEAQVETYLGASSEMYMSANHLYTAVGKYEASTSNQTKGMADMIIAPVDMDTEIIQFNIDNGSITFNASTVVNGTLLNQFSMDERNGTFRVATTKGTMWSQEIPSTNNLYTFDTNLNPLGKVEGLAEGERIFSVRFMENVAYMVTFRQVDPLFVIDLKDPNNPKVLGELKIPGFSNYLHPLDDHHVIGFGQHTELVDVPEMDEPLVRQSGLKISVFDVSDPANPKEKFTEILGDSGSFSEITYDHKALYKHPEENLFGIPAQLYESKMVQKGNAVWEDISFVYEGAFLYNISPDKGIELKDTITHQKENIKYPEWESQIKRMVSVNDTLYTLSYNQIKIYNLTQQTTQKTLNLPTN